MAKFVRDNEDQLVDLPKEFDSKAKMKKLKDVAFPLVLPILKEYEFAEGHFDNKEVFTSIVDLHDLYFEWIFLHSRKHIINLSFSAAAEECPLPDNACIVSRR